MVIKRIKTKIIYTASSLNNDEDYDKRSEQLGGR